MFVLIINTIPYFATKRLLCSTLVSLVEYYDCNEPDPATIIPMVDATVRLNGGNRFTSLPVRYLDPQFLGRGGARHPSWSHCLCRMRRRAPERRGAYARHTAAQRRALCPLRGTHRVAAPQALRK